MTNFELAIYLSGVCKWAVFPCSQAKNPIISAENGGHGRHDATADPLKIGAWWRRYPGALVGVNCAKSGLTVIDLDRHPGKPDGVENWRRLSGNNSGCGVLQLTPGGGVHLVFKALVLPDGFTMPTALVELDDVGMGVDIPLSFCTGVLADGRKYEFRPVGLPTPAQCKNEVPEFVAELIGKINGRRISKERELRRAAEKKAAQPARDGMKPGENFAQQVTWEQLLSPYGFDPCKKEGQFTRPGGHSGHVHATITNKDNLYVWSTDCPPFESGMSYSKFAAFTLLECGGDFRTASRKLVDAGYGR